MSINTSILNNLIANNVASSNAYYEATQSGGNTSSALTDLSNSRIALSNYQNSGVSSVLSSNNSTIDSLMSNLSSGTGTSSDASQVISLSKQNAAIQTATSASKSLNDTINSFRSGSGTSSIVSSATSSLTGSSSASSRITPQSDRRIKLRPKVGISSWATGSILLKPLLVTGGFVFPYAVNVTIKNQASYGQQKTTHANQDFRYYTNTPSQTFEISSYLTAQDTTEAEYMVAAMQFFSAVTKMHFGTTDSNAGVPPPVLLLSGFGPYIFNDLPVIVESFTYSYTDDVDLVSVTINGAKNDVPTMMRISAVVTVQNTPDKLRTFNWDEFVSGKLLSQGGWK